VGKEEGSHSWRAEAVEVASIPELKINAGSSDGNIEGSVSEGEKTKGFSGGQTGNQGNIKRVSARERGASPTRVCRKRASSAARRRDKTMSNQRMEVGIGDEVGKEESESSIRAQCRRCCYGGGTRVVSSDGSVLIPHNSKWWCQDRSVQ